MHDYEKELTACLSDTGFTDEVIGEAVRFCKAGQKAELIHFLRMRRCGLIEELHERQKKIDRFDYMIRQTEKQM